MSSITLKSPTLGSSRSLVTHTITKPLLSNNFIQLRPSYWDSVTQHRFIFQSIPRSKKEELVTLLINYAGKTIIINDSSNSLTWSGFVLGNIEITQLNRREIAPATGTSEESCELYTITFTFEGALV